jgi:purine-binding chemotaxis protein CheW
VNQATLLDDRAGELRQEFDEGFARRPGETSANTEALLAIAVAGGAYALRLREITGLYVHRKIIPLPGAPEDLLGLASFRGALVPIYDLRRLLGHSSATVPRWQVLVAGQSPAGLAFDRFEAYLDVPVDAIARDARPDAARPYIVGAVRSSRTVRSLLSTASIVEAITMRVQSGNPRREQ